MGDFGHLKLWELDCLDLTVAWHRKSIDWCQGTKRLFFFFYQKRKRISANMFPTWKTQLFTQKITIQLKTRWRYQALMYNGRVRWCAYKTFWLYLLLTLSPHSNVTLRQFVGLSVKQRKFKLHWRQQLWNLHLLLCRPGLGRFVLSGAGAIPPSLPPFLHHLLLLVLLSEGGVSACRRPRLSQSQRGPLPGMLHCSSMVTLGEDTRSWQVVHVCSSPQWTRKTKQNKREEGWVQFDVKWVLFLWFKALFLSDIMLNDLNTLRVNVEPDYSDPLWSV